MIGVSSILFDLLGSVIIPSKLIMNTEDDNLSRRVSSTKTLDGGSFVSDFGYSPTDEPIVIKVRGLSRIDTENLKRISKIHSLIRVCSKNGCFECVVKTMLFTANEINIVFLVVREI